MLSTAYVHLGADEPIDVEVRTDDDGKPYPVVAFGPGDNRVVILPTGADQVLALATALFGLAAELATAKVQAFLGVCEVCAGTGITLDPNHGDLPIACPQCRTDEHIAEFGRRTAAAVTA